jgi:tetratricopeptide (TPR) repeat protein
MLTIKNQVGNGENPDRGPSPARSAQERTNAANRGRLAVCQVSALLMLVVLGLLAGCTPPGPRALLRGQRLIEQGDYARAAEKLRTATSLMATNAQAWNYLGIACQHLGKGDEAVRAYQRALSLNHDLSEAHFNLGCLWLEQNKLDAARTEFTTFTLRRGNSVEGFLKLATVQARARDFAAAEKSYNDALRLNPHNPEALNGLGLIRLQQRRPTEAEPYFAGALKQQPDYGPALLNSAIVAQEYQHDLPTALSRYRQYLALKPSPPNADAVRNNVRELEKALSPPQRPAPVVKAPPPVPKASLPAATTVPSAKIATTSANRALTAPKADIAASTPRLPPATNPPKAAAAVSTPQPQPVQVVKVTPETTVTAAEQLTPKPAPVSVSHAPAEPIVTTSSVPVSAAGPKPPKRGFFERVNPINVFRSEPKPPATTTPLPPATQASVTAQREPAAPGPAAPPAGPYSRYNYRSPATPAPGNRAEAQRYFDQGVEAQRAHRLNDAIQAYRAATQSDPSFFEAQFYLAFAAAQAGDLVAALSRYENALAIAPNDANARYNFALVLKQANCVPDAVNELQRLVAAHPSEARAHLALANIYAQQLRQPSVARAHYLKALELDPRGPQATDIRNWLRDHPQ